MVSIRGIQSGVQKHALHYDYTVTMLTMKYEIYCSTCPPRDLSTVHLRPVKPGPRDLSNPASLPIKIPP
jgi:hypothetical protein